MKFRSSITFAALVLLQQLKVLFLTAHRSSENRLFISSLVSEMEREMCQYLNWELNVKPCATSGLGAEPEGSPSVPLWRIFFIVAFEVICDDTYSNRQRLSCSPAFDLCQLKTSLAENM